MNKGQKVELLNNLPSQWFIKPTPLLTGVVEKVFKNGKFSVSVDQLPNRSNDGKTTLHFTQADLIGSWEPA